jgi:hypothetical protein
MPMRIHALVFMLLLAGCASRPRQTILTLSDFSNDTTVYAAYLQSYSAGYEAALRMEGRDTDYFGVERLGPAEKALLRAKAIGWTDGQRDCGAATLFLFRKQAVK